MEEVFDDLLRFAFQRADQIFDMKAAIVIFTGPDGKRMPDRFEYEFLNTRLIYQYNALCILGYGDEELASSENPFALVILAAKKALARGKDVDSKLLKGKLFVFRKLYERGIFGKPKMEAV